MSNGNDIRRNNAHLHQHVVFLDLFDLLSCVHIKRVFEVFGQLVCALILEGFFGSCVRGSVWSGGVTVSLLAVNRTHDVREAIDDRREALQPRTTLGFFPEMETTMSYLVDTLSETVRRSADPIVNRLVRNIICVLAVLAEGAVYLLSGRVEWVRIAALHRVDSLVRKPIRTH